MKKVIGAAACVPCEPSCRPPPGEAYVLSAQMTIFNVGTRCRSSTTRVRALPHVRKMTVPVQQT